MVERPRRAADRRPPRGPGRAGAAGLPRGARLQRRARGQQRPARGARVRARWTAPGRRAASSAAASTSSTSRRPSAACRAPAASTTSPGPRLRRSTCSGARRRSPAGAQPTPEIDRFYFKSIYFREPSGVLFEIATTGPRLHRRRAARAPRREALAAARLRAPARRGRTEPATGEEPAHGPAGVNGDFIWRDAGRTVVFRRNGVAQAPQLLREHGFEPFELLSTDAGARPAPPSWPTAAGGRARGRAPARSPTCAAELLETRSRLPASAGRARRRPPDRRRQGGRRGHRRRGRGDPDDDVGGGDDRRSTACRPGRRRGSARLVRPRAGDRRPGGDDEPAGGAAAGELDERARARRRLALHAVRQPGLGDDGAARRGADRGRARPGRRRSATRAAWRSARCSAATRSTPPASASTTSSARPWSASAAARTPRPTRRSCRGRWRCWSRGRRTRSPASPRRSSTDPEDIEARVLAARRRPSRPRRRSAPTAPSSTRRSTRCSVRPELAFVPGPPLTRARSARSWSTRAWVTAAPLARVALCVTAERLARYHAYTRKHSVNWPLYLLAQGLPDAVLPRLLPLRAHRPRARPAQGRADRRLQPPQLPRPLRDRRLPALAAADELRRQGRAVRAPLAGLDPLPARRLPDPPRRVRRGVDGDGAPGRRTRRRGLHLPRGHADPPRHPRPAPSAASAASRCRPARR